MTRTPALALLAGGLATRMRPHTLQVPKALVEVAGEPFIAHQLRLLRRNGISRVVLCVAYLGEQIEALVKDGAEFGIDVDYSYDGPTLLGTGGALRRALGRLGSEFFVMYGDSWLDAAFTPIFDAFRASGKSALMTVYRNSDRWDKSNVWFESGRILAHDKTRRSPEMRHIDWGLSVIKADALVYQAPDTPFDLADIYSELAQQGGLAGYEISTRFYEIGSAEGLRETDALLRGKVQRL
jgi:NDP-sugar pyrophosphorylase family protein